MLKKRRFIRNILLAVIGSVCYAVAISLFLNPNNLAPGGASGIAIMTNHLTGLSVGAVIVIINIPLMILGFIKLGRKFAIGTGACILLTSALTDLAALMKPITSDRILASLTGGAFLAVGLALIFKTGATTGGSDIVVRLLRLKYKHIRSGTILFMIDGIISLLSGFVYGDFDVALYALVSLVVTSIVMDIVLYGSDEARLSLIITDKQNVVVKKIFDTLEVGASIIDAKGAYSKKGKSIVLCATTKQLLPRLEETVLSADENSFMIVTSANEIYGEGFKRNMELY